MLRCRVARATKGAARTTAYTIATPIAGPRRRVTSKSAGRPSDEHVGAAIAYDQQEGGEHDAGGNQLFVPRAHRVEQQPPETRPAMTTSTIIEALNSAANESEQRHQWIRSGASARRQSRRRTGSRVPRPASTYGARSASSMLARTWRRQRRPGDTVARGPASANGDRDRRAPRRRPRSSAPAARSPRSATDPSSGDDDERDRDQQSGTAINVLTPARDDAVRPTEWIAGRHIQDAERQQIVRGHDERAATRCERVHSPAARPAARSATPIRDPSGRDRRAPPSLQPLRVSDEERTIESLRRGATRRRRSGDKLCSRRAFAGRIPPWCERGVREHDERHSGQTQAPARRMRRTVKLRRAAERDADRRCGEITV